MEININKENDELTIAPIGRIDSATSDEFLAFIEENFTEEINKLIIDFKDVDFISSKGLRVLVSIYKNLKEKKMEITNANVSVMEILRLSGLLKVVEVK